MSYTPNRLDGDVLGEKLDYLVDILAEYRRQRGMTRKQDTALTLALKAVLLEMNIHIEIACGGKKERIEEDRKELETIKDMLPTYFGGRNSTHTKPDETLEV